MILKKVTIPGRFPGLNDFMAATRKHRLMGAAMKSEYTELARLHFISYQKISDQVVIHFEWYEKDMKRDCDNVVFAKKFIIDGIVKARVLPDDSRKWVQGFTDSVMLDRLNPRVEVTIEELGP